MEIEVKEETGRFDMDEKFHLTVGRQELRVIAMSLTQCGVRVGGDLFEFIGQSGKRRMFTDV